MKSLTAKKPMFEKVLPPPHASWRYVIYELGHIPFNWHYHPEYEIAVTVNGAGHRYVGDNIEAYDTPDLVLLGPNLPHTWCSQPLPLGRVQVVYVAQIPSLWLDSLVDGMPELHALSRLLDRARRGLKFSLKTARACAVLFSGMALVDSFARLLKLLEALRLMIEDEHARELSSPGHVLPPGTRDLGLERIERVMHYIHSHYTEDLSAEELARLAHMSTNHFHRFIKQRTEQTFTELVTQLRIGKACSLLINSELPVAAISRLCGFNNLSNFNRRFQQVKKTTPSTFRRAYISRSSTGW